MSSAPSKSFIAIAVALASLCPTPTWADSGDDDSDGDGVVITDGDGGPSLQINVGGSATDDSEALDGGIGVSPLVAGPDGGYPYGVDGRCLEVEEESGPLGDILGALRLEVSGAHLELRELRLVGLTALDPKAVATLVGLPDGKVDRPLTPELAAVLVARLAGTGLFEQVTPRVLQELGGVGVLEVELHEFPRVTGVQITGLTESRPEELMHILLEAPAAPRAHRHPRGSITLPVHIKQIDDALERFAANLPSRRRAGCGWVRPPSTWLALPAGSTVVPGIVWHGIPRSLERMIGSLRVHGYLLASAQAHLGADGILHVEVDEGRLTEVRIEGVDAAVEDRVRERVGIKAGDVLLSSEVSRGIAQVVGDLPFLSAIESHHLAGGPFPTSSSTGADGTRTYVVGNEPPVTTKASRRHRDDDADDDDDTDEDDVTEHEGRGRRSRSKSTVAHAVHGAELHGHVLTLYFEAHEWSGSEMDWRELVHHTQVTGFAPGLGGTLRYADPGARVNVAIDAQLNVNSRRPSLTSDGDLLAQMASQQRVDWLVGPKVQLPGLDIAELGVQAHSLTDTTDRWHMDTLDAYLGSAWGNRPDSWYFRRSGAEAYVTVHLFERLTVGAEYRIDRYEGLSPLNHVWTVFNQDEHAFPNPTFGAVEVGSVVGRLEYSTDKRAIDKVGERHRDTERSLVAFIAPAVTSYRCVNTIEVADPSLGGEASFTRVISDHRLYLASGSSSGFTLRVRGAGENGAVPLPKQESLGGWDALRGYAFDEFHGDRSILGTAEYRWQIIGVFTDVGAVRQLNGEWIAPRLGAGAELAFGDEVHLEAAWRTDNQATAVPSVRLMFERTF